MDHEPPPDDHTPQPGQTPARRRGRWVLPAVAAGTVGLLAAAVGLALALRASPSAPQATTPGGPSLLADRPAASDPFPLPVRTLEGFAGGPPVDIAAYAGQPLLVNFWASWCAPCVEEMPDFQHAHEQLERNVAFLGVNVQDSPTNAQAFVDELDVTYDLASDPQAAYYGAVRAFGMPTTLFVDAQQQVVFRHTGALSAEQLADLLFEHLGVRLTS